MNPRLPFGRRIGLANPFVPSTDAPDRKVMGPVQVQLALALKTPTRAIVASKPLTIKPPGMFERAFAGQPIPQTGFTSQLKLRLATEHADRIVRARAAPRVTLGRGGQGWDWVRFGRRIKPRLPGGFSGMVAKVRRIRERGTMAQHLTIPLATQARLADKAVAPMRAVLPEGVNGTPTLTQPVQPATNGHAKVEQETPFQLVYLLAAVAVVYLLTRGRS